MGITRLGSGSESPRTGSDQDFILPIGRNRCDGHSRGEHVFERGGQASVERAGSGPRHHRPRAGQPVVTDAPAVGAERNRGMDISEDIRVDPQAQ